MPRYNNKPIKFDQVYIGNVHFIGRRVLMKLTLIDDADRTYEFDLDGIIETSKSYMYNKRIRIDKSTISDIFETINFDDMVRNGYIYNSDNLDFNHKYRTTADIVQEDDDLNLIFCIGQAETNFKENGEEEDIREEVYFKFDKQKNNFPYAFTERQKRLIQLRIVAFLN